MSEGEQTQLTSSVFVSSGLKRIKNWKKETFRAIYLNIFVAHAFRANDVLRHKSFFCSIRRWDDVRILTTSKEYDCMIIIKTKINSWLSTTQQCLCHTHTFVCKLCDRNYLIMWMQSAISIHGLTDSDECGTGVILVFSSYASDREPWSSELGTTWQMIDIW